ncbi:hypothetical protein [Streptomyces malaysiensis]|nr:MULTISPECIES: hypothetical protein [Streptomyces]
MVHELTHQFFVSGRDLTSYIKSWIYGRTTPPTPGHQDWKPGKPS